MSLDKRFCNEFDYKVMLTFSFVIDLLCIVITGCQHVYLDIRGTMVFKGNIIFFKKWFTLIRIQIYKLIKTLLRFEIDTHFDKGGNCWLNESLFGLDLL